MLAACSREPKVEPTGFSSVSAEIDDRRVCLLLAETVDQRSKGLMNVTSLGRYDGMVFRFPNPTSGAFYMFHTKLPLTIGFVGADAKIVSVLDMEPCTSEDPNACPRYNPGVEYVDAIEMQPPRARSTGLKLGAAVKVGGAC